MERQARRLIRAAVLSLLFLAPLAARALAVDASPGFSPDELKVLLRLEKDGYIMHASCAEIASALLTQVGLPALGQTTPVRGNRLDLDRRGEGTEPPMFLDGVIRSGNPYHALKVDARAVGTNWVLRLTREFRPRGKPPLKLEASYVFQPDSRLNHPACELESIAFRGLATRAVPAWNETLDAHDCIALSGLESETAGTWIKNSTYLGWAKEDCNRGLHYFKSIKTALIEQAKKRIR